MAHGAGGKATSRLVEGLLAPAFGIDTLDDAAAVDDLAITTDAFVVKPLVFPGGSIGDLAVNGTVNDLAMAGARPLALTLSLILEEGLEASVLRAEVDAMARAAETAGVQIVGGDTKVVERGHADGMYVTTTGLGRRDPRAQFTPARPATRSCSPARSASTAPRSCSRAGSSTSTPTSSPTRAPVARGRRAAGRRRHPRLARPDPRRRRLRAQRARARRRRGDARARGRRARRTRRRRGLRAARHRPHVRRQRGQAHRPRRARARGRGPGRAAALRAQAADIGEIKTEPPGMVLVETSFGGRRVMDELVGDPLPRIC